MRREETNRHFKNMNLPLKIAGRRDGLINIHDDGDLPIANMFREGEALELIENVNSIKRVMAERDAAKAALVTALVTRCEARLQTIKERDALLDVVKLLTREGWNTYTRNCVAKVIQLCEKAQVGK